MKILYCDAHSVLTHDEMKLFHSLGNEVFNVGGYIHPSRPMEDARPGLDIPEIPELIESVDLLGQPNHPRHGKCSGELPHHDTLEAAKSDLPDRLIEWADVIMFAAKEHTWLIPQWDRIKGKRVIWRTIGQSGDQNELAMAPIHEQGCEIVRYSPKEWNIPNFAGSDALIRFYKDPDEWQGWTGQDVCVTNVTQSMVHRSLDNDGRLQPVGYQWTNLSYWLDATKGLPVRPMGPESDRLGGVGKVTYEEMRTGLKRSRAYLFTCTQPASYTLGFMEAMLTGIPIVSIGPDRMQILPYGPLIFEGHELALLTESDPLKARGVLVRLLKDIDYARDISAKQRTIALDLFGMPGIAAKWQEYLTGQPSVQVERELVAA